jgi:hypothetical protein
MTRLAAAILPALLATLPAVPALANPAVPAGCPPGLAKKSPPCVPPGQARKGVILWKPGDFVPPDRISHWIVRPTLYGLPPLGLHQRYIVVDGQILSVDYRTFQVIALFQVITRLLD